MAMELTVLTNRAEETARPTLEWEGGFPVVTIDGVRITVRKLLSDGDSNTKLKKNGGRGYLTAGLSLAPWKTAGIGNVCPHASAGCAQACLDHQGMASVFASIRRARRAKTVVWYLARQWFLAQLRKEIELAQNKAERQGLRLAVRLNVFSDIAWEDHGIVDEFPSVQFYDYTKNPKRAGAVRPNYWVTFSRSETNEADALHLLSQGRNATVVFAHGLPRKWNGHTVIDGDETDLRFTDPRGRKGRVIGLVIKAHSQQERDNAIASGFAV
jgi:hypothetical protein